MNYLDPQIIEGLLSNGNELGAKQPSDPISLFGSDFAIYITSYLGGNLELSDGTEIVNGDDIYLLFNRSDFNVDNLNNIYHHTLSDTHEMEFLVNGVNLYVSNIVIDEETDENYFYDESNLAKVIDEITDYDITLP